MFCREMWLHAIEYKCFTTTRQYRPYNGSESSSIAASAIEKLTAALEFVVRGERELKVCVICEREQQWQ